jgi:hypothetical protein
MTEGINNYEALIQYYESGQIEPHEFVRHMDEDEVFAKYVFKRLLGKGKTREKG